MKFHNKYGITYSNNDFFEDGFRNKYGMTKNNEFCNGYGMTGRNKKSLLLAGFFVY
ncbi:hypothetical protein P278_15370 [Zhouia amylolytica AD3]|uniref:Uncharacterized protein n=1 Tax=Zhouia amylolytica AD3 TaxID=1286632 RepID=W2UNU2_9FLAO|nr:hypothetical protein P278_15370 [Zhouia amylolytica AD3]